MTSEPRLPPEPNINQSGLPSCACQVVIGGVEDGSQREAALAKAGGSSATVLISGFLAVNLAFSILV